MQQWSCMCMHGFILDDCNFSHQVVFLMLDIYHILQLPLSAENTELVTRPVSLLILDLYKNKWCACLESIFIPFNFKALSGFITMSSESFPVASSGLSPHPVVAQGPSQSMFNLLRDDWNLVGCNHRLRLGLKCCFTLNHKKASQESIGKLLIFNACVHVQACNPLPKNVLAMVNNSLMLALVLNQPSVQSSLSSSY